MEVKKQYRPEIEGLRVVAALLVAIYHIWMMRVSGGVDVFFVVSGFLITTSLLSKYARDGYIKFTTFILGLLKRLLPNALIVLIFVVIAGYFILPEVRHSETIREVIASLFYFENWQLAVTGTDYLDQNNEKSPVQHFWAMSIQGQFYIIWFLIISLAIFLNKKMKIDFKKLFAIVLSVLFILSFGYSIYLTEVNQPWAYFDTRTRVWEFAIGGILMLVIFKIKIPQVISLIIGWIGLAGLISTGLILEVETSFPGYVALWPIVSAVLIMLAGQNPSNFGVEKFLGSKLMIKLGGLSYGLYLWHWPLLAFYYVIFDTHNVSLISGILLILLSLLLSYLSTSFIEKPIARFVTEKQYSIKAFTPVLSMIGVLVLALAMWIGFNKYQSSLADQFKGDPNYPGALASTEEFEDLEEVDPIPDLGSLKSDKAEPYTDGCHVSPGVSEVGICEYGEVEDYDYTVALVGGSKSTHWLPSLQSFAEDDSIRILNVTKSGCQFSYGSENDDRDQDCIDWNENVINDLSSENPDLVVTLADTGSVKQDEVPEGYINQFNRLNEHGIEVMAIRDTPYFDKNVSECLGKNGVESKECDMETSDFSPDEAAWEKLDNPPENVHYVDYSEYICKDGTCPAVIGNIVAYIDKSHMSATFNETFGPIVEQDIMGILEDITPNKDSQNVGEESATEEENKEEVQNNISENNLINFDTIEEGTWIYYDGEFIQGDQMMLTESIKYNPESEYILNSGAYVSYFNDDEFIQTTLYSEGFPLNIDTVEDANNIRLSFNRAFSDRIELEEE